MYYYHIAPTILVRRADSFFTYHATQSLEPGHIVTIPIGTRECIGIVLNPTTKPGFATKPISTVVEPTPLPHALIQTAQWMSQYYHVHLASCLSAMLPRGLTTKLAPPTNRAAAECQPAGRHYRAAAAVSHHQFALRCDWFWQNACV